MIKEKILTEKVQCCDACEVTLYPPLSVRNDGSYQDTFIRIGNIDLCYKCGARILESLRAPEEKAQVWVEKLRETMKNDNGLFRGTLDSLSGEVHEYMLLNSTVTNEAKNEIKNNPTSLSNIDKAPSLASLDLVTLSVPNKTSSSIPNLGEL